MKYGSLTARDVYRLRVALSPSLPRNIAHPVLIIMVGLPGSGKSYFVSQLVHQIPAVILESDYLRKILIKRPIYSPKEHFRVFGAIHTLTREFLEAKYHVILDATNLNEEYRQPLLKIAEETNAKSIIVHMATSREVAQNRLTKRIAEQEGYSDANWAG